MSSSSARTSLQRDGPTTPPFYHSSFRDFGGSSATDLLSPAKRKQRRMPRKRIHLVRNPLLCGRCWKVWEEDHTEATGLYIKSKSGKPVQHKGCGGQILRYYEITSADLIQFAMEKLFRDVQYRTFYPVMGDLVRPDSQDNQHHSIPCVPSDVRTCFYSTIHTRLHVLLCD